MSPFLFPSPRYPVYVVVGDTFTVVVVVVVVATAAGRGMDGRLTVNPFICVSSV